MPQIELLPASTTTTSTPGWAYVPDTGYDPSKAAIIPTGSRKRANRGSTNIGVASSGSDGLSARQQSKITAYLENLQKDSLKDVQIVLHHKSRDLGSRGIRGKMTPNVRKVVSSQKTFANHLADEEARVQSTRQTSHTVAAISSGGGDDAMDVDTIPQAPESSKSMAEIEVRKGIEGIEGESAFLTKLYIPSLPSDAEIEALLAAPPLSYNAARAAPTSSTAPARQFCSMCGYWGSIKCIKCGARVCGLDCKLAHDEGKCFKF